MICCLGSTAVIYAFSIHSRAMRNSPQQLAGGDIPSVDFDLILSKGPKNVVGSLWREFSKMIGIHDEFKRHIMN